MPLFAPSYMKKNGKSIIIAHNFIHKEFQLLMPQLPIELLQLSKDQQSVSVVIRAIDTPVSLELLKQLFDNSSWHHFKLDIDQLKVAAQSFEELKDATDDTRVEEKTAAQSEQLIQAAHSEQLIQIATRVDAQLSIEIDDEKITATALLVSAYDGEPISATDFIEKVKELGITEGIAKKIIKLLLKKSQAGNPGARYSATIAKGIPAINSTNAKLKRLVETLKERILKPATKENGKVDMRNLGKLSTVDVGTVLMRKVPIIEGHNGHTVTGEIIPFQHGQDHVLIAGPNTVINENDENELLSTLAGIPKLILNGMSVDEILNITNVDPTSGNVEYKGSILITGNISDGMHVKATGNITVAGFVESANIECGGDLIVGKGIIGQKTDEDADTLSCNVTCGGSVIANFSQYSSIKCAENINIKTQLLHCNVTSIGDINVHNDACTKGSIFGGHLTTNASIHTANLGTSAGAKTVITLLSQYEQLIADKRAIQQQLTEYKLTLKKILDAQLKNEQSPPSEKKQLLDFQLLETKENITSKIDLCSEDLNHNLEQQQKCADNNRVLVFKELYQGVHVNISDDTYKTYKNYGPTELRITDGKIQNLPYNQNNKITK